MRVHQIKAKSFYSLLKDKSEDVLILSFDCQKNQVLPKVPDQSAYYSRQLYKYNFTIVVGHSKCPQTKENTFIYHWDETQYAKGSNEISSAVYDCLCRLEIPESIKTVRIMADGCGGQNKNITLIGMLSAWFLKANINQNINKVEVIFPVVGHSFLPSDRVFARIEKVVKKKTVIVSPNDYTAIFGEFGTTIPLEGKVFDWKSAIEEVVKPPGSWHFKFKPSKRFILKKDRKGVDVLVEGEVNYRINIGALKSICKKRKTIQDLKNPEQIAAGAVEVSPLKLQDVKNLLSKHYGENWRDQEILSFFRNVIN